MFGCTPFPVKPLGHKMGPAVFLPNPSDYFFVPNNGTLHINQNINGFAGSSHRSP